MKKFHCHPDRAEAAYRRGILEIDTVVDKYVPLRNDAGEEILGWWIDESVFDLRWLDLKVPMKMDSTYGAIWETKHDKP